MKNIVKSVVFAALVTGLASCDGEDNFMFVEPAGEFQILSPISGDAVILNPETPANPALSLTWEDANYGTPTSVTYTVEVDKAGDEFDTPYELTQTTNTYATITVEELNTAADEVGLTPFTQGGLEVRIRSSVGTGEMQVYSTVITYLVTPYSTELPKMAVTGNHQNPGWDPATAPQLAAAGWGQKQYEGFVWLDGGFKFVAANATGGFSWDDSSLIYGDDGSFSGQLASPGDNMTAAAGYYLVRANIAAEGTGAMTYSTTGTTWGIIGSGTPGGWDNSTVLTYNPTTKTWEGDVTLTDGMYKFRANNAWTINLGGDPDGDGSMNFDGPDIAVPAPGSYHVVLDLSNPRKYTHTITAN